MKPVSQFSELDETTVFMWIGQIRCSTVSESERKAAEVRLYQTLVPVSTWFAYLRNSPTGYDSEQVVIDSICQFILVYVRNLDFDFQSCGHIVGLLSKITTNRRRMSYRWIHKSKRTPNDLDGSALPIESLHAGANNYQANSEDPASLFENLDEVDHFLQLLSQDVHRQVLQLLLADYTWSEIGTKLDVDLKTVRLWVAQIRRSLKPHTSRLTPRASDLTSHISQPTPQSGSFARGQ